MYKCWHHLGVNNLVVGNVLLNKIFTNYNVIARYMKGEDYLDDAKCKECKYSIVCGGGCPDLRLNNPSSKKNETYCSIFNVSSMNYN
ncbi:SPASM domain-containing protein [uncultured Phocaeicola sp.]|uniref:SPASM domain-containing protein n=1 Tax=uncultured Phocaeicola sp. TaxID=990718 RepID=UPI00341A8C4E